MVKLKSGREIEPKELSWRDFATVKDESLQGHNKGIPISLVLAGETVLKAGLIKSLDDLKTWNDEETYEAFGIIIEQNTLKDSQKKSWR